MSMNTENFAQVDSDDELANELHHALKDIEKILRTMQDDHKMEIVYRMETLASGKLDQSNFETTAQSLSTYAVRTENILRKALFDVQKELDCMNYQIGMGIKAEDCEKP